jgi:hypothetical protein
LHNLALFWVKNANFFAKFFGENILKIITSVPGHPASVRLLKLSKFCTWLLSRVYTTHAPLGNF